MEQLSSDNNGQPQRAPVHEEVERIIRLMCASDPGPLSPDVRMETDLGFDSLRRLELAVIIERQFCLTEVNMDHAFSVSTLQDVVDLVNEKRLEVKP